MTDSLSRAISPSSRARSAQSAHSFTRLPDTITVTSSSTSSLHPRQVSMTEVSVICEPAGLAMLLRPAASNRARRLLAARPGEPEGRAAALAGLEPGAPALGLDDLAH